MQNRADMMKFAKTLAQDAGKTMLRYFDADDNTVQQKVNLTPVTVADKLINQLVIDSVETAYPAHGVLGEEGSSHQDRKELWVCDPIDGTKSFIMHIPTAMFSLAFVVDGSPELAVMFDPFQDKLYSAVRGEGAWLNDKPIHVTTAQLLDGADVGGLTGYHDLKSRRSFFDNLLEHNTNIVIVPGAVFKGALVAAGNIDAMIFPGKSAHDMAAVKLVVEEAGGKVTDLHGKEQRYDSPIYGAIVSNGNLHDELVELLQRFGPENFIGY